MAQKLGQLAILWFAIFFCYIILANVYPAFTVITAASAIDTAATGNATSGMINWPVQFLGVMPLLVWFIPGGLGIAATVVWLREK